MSPGDVIEYDWATGGSHIVLVLGNGGIAAHSTSCLDVSPPTDSATVHYIHILDTAAPVPQVTVTSPTTGANWPLGVSHTITWTVTGNTSQINNFLVSYSIDGGATFLNDVGTAYSTDRSISWTPPLVISPTAVGQIRVEARDASNSVLSQAFSGTFTFNLSLTGLTPSQVIQAYGISNIKFGSTPGDGTGQTIAIIDLGDDSAIENDLAVFDQEFGLAAPPSFKVVGETGGAPSDLRQPHL